MLANELNSKDEDEDKRYPTSKLKRVEVFRHVLKWMNVFRDGAENNEEKLKGGCIKCES